MRRMKVQVPDAQHIRRRHSSSKVSCVILDFVFSLLVFHDGSLVDVGHVMWVLFVY